MSALQLPMPAAGPRLGPPRLRLLDRRPDRSGACSGASRGPSASGGPAPADRTRALAPTTRAQAIRRQLLAAVGLLAAVLVGLDAAAGPAVGTAPTPVAAATVVVEPGETVWDVAVRTAPDGTSTASWASAIIEVNGLDGGVVDSWQVLLVPAG